MKNKISVAVLHTLTFFIKKYFRIVDLLTDLKIIGNAVNHINGAGGSSAERRWKQQKCCFRVETTVSAGMELVVPSSRNKL